MSSAQNRLSSPPVGIGARGGLHPGNGAARSAAAGYQLAWSDEFERDGWPDPRNWTYERGFVRNDEHQWYQADNAIVKRGNLVIEARRESKPDPTYDCRRASSMTTCGSTERSSASAISR